MSYQNKKVIALIVAAGRGSRFGDDCPKQYHNLNGQMVLTHTIAAYASHPLVSAVKVVIHPDDVDLYNIAVKGLTILPFCLGGKERQDSVRLGLQDLAQENPDIVLIQDGARPFTDFETIFEVINNIEKGKGAIAAIPATDTIKSVTQKGSYDIADTIDRSILWRAQTPQGFVYDDIMEAHEKGRGKSLTDDAAVFMENGGKVVVVKSTDKNLKITTIDDLQRANQEHNSACKSFKVGFGFDVHAFTDGNEVCLCGVKIPSSHSLLGHSDADVALHALADALYGAIGAGDIGLYFPPTDNKWKGMASKVFVQHAAGLVKAKGGIIQNVDITIICEFPKVGMYRSPMIKNVAEILGIPQNSVNVKGTTTEKLGFTGRGEGIASQAVASIMF